MVWELVEQGKEWFAAICVSSELEPTGYGLTYDSIRRRAIFEMTEFARREPLSRMALITMALTLRSSNDVACWRRAISSNLGCFHLPGVATSCSFCARGVAGAELGVLGVAGAWPWAVRVSWLMSGGC